MIPQADWKPWANIWTQWFAAADRIGGVRVQHIYQTWTVRRVMKIRLPNCQVHEIPCATYQNEIDYSSMGQPWSEMPASIAGVTGRRRRRFRKITSDGPVLGWVLGGTSRRDPQWTMPRPAAFANQTNGARPSGRTSRSPLVAAAASLARAPML
jgi:hypothetical protein